ncbi:hypothetical protein [Leptolyngbya sp. PCC 6406]|nr:hypothetical protein [Leptolyngbya sp. PCC 6406]
MGVLGDAIAIAVEVCALVPRQSHLRSSQPEARNQEMGGGGAKGTGS